MNEMMTCGHTANAVNEDKKPVCVMCMCYDVKNDKPSLEGRKARCVYSHDNHYSRNGGAVIPQPVDSRWDLPFFKYNENYKEDEYYCGCFGWD